MGYYVYGPNMHRLPQTVLLFALAFIAIARLAGDDKPAAVDGKKLIGKWDGEFPLIGGRGNFEGSVNVVLEFTADGKFEQKLITRDKTTAIDGSCTLTANKLTLEPPAGKDTSPAALVVYGDWTITKLTDEALEWRNRISLSFLRIKPPGAPAEISSNPVDEKIRRRWL